MNPAISKPLALLFLCLLAIGNVKASLVDNEYFKVDTPQSFVYYNQSSGSIIYYVFKSSSAEIDIKVDLSAGEPVVTAIIQPLIEGAVDSDIIRLLKSLEVKKLRNPTNVSLLDPANIFFGVNNSKRNIIFTDH